MAEFISAFRDAELTDIPPIENLEDTRPQALWVLWVGRERAEVSMMTPAEISLVLRDVYGILVSRQRIGALLYKEGNSVARRKKNGRRAYQIMQSGIEEVSPTAISSGLRPIEGTLNVGVGTNSSVSQSYEGDNLQF